MNNASPYLPSAVFIAQALVRLSKQIKQIIQTEHNWPEANQLPIYKRSRGFELGATEKQVQVVVRAGLDPGAARLQVRHAVSIHAKLGHCARTVVTK